MKKIFFITCLLPLFALGQKSSLELTEEGLKKYELEKAKIMYEITGGASGTETFLFERYGWRSVKRRNMEFELYDAQRNQRQHEVTDGNVVYRINHGDSTIQKRTDSKWTIALTTMTPQEASEDILFSMGGNYSADSVVLDRKCQVWTFEGKALQELWTWKGLVLKRKTKLGDNLITTTATSLNTDISIDILEYQIPDTYRIFLEN